MTGSRTCGACPEPSNGTRPPPCPARAAPRLTETVASSSPWITRTGQRDTPRELLRLSGNEWVLRGREQRLGVGLEPPADGVLDRLGRMRLREQVRDEELDEAVVVAEPVVSYCASPSPHRCRARSSQWSSFRSGTGSPPPGKLDRRRRRLDSLGMVGREEQAALSAQREPHDDRALGLGRVHHGERVGRELGSPRTPRPLGRSERPLPRPSNVTRGSGAQDTGSASSSAVSGRATRSAAGGRLARPSRRPRSRAARRRARRSPGRRDTGHGSVRGRGRGQLDSHRSIQSRSAAWPVSIPPRRSTMTPMLKVMTRETSARAACRSLLPPRLLERSVSTARHSALTPANRSRSPCRSTRAPAAPARPSRR